MKRTLEGIIPLLARTVLGVAAVTTVLSLATTVAVGQVSILWFTAFSVAAGSYARKVLRAEGAHASVEPLEPSVTRLAA